MTPRTLGDVIARIKTEDKKVEIDGVCAELAVCARNAAAVGDDGSARRIQVQIMRLRALEASL